LGERYAANLALDQVLGSALTRERLDWHPHRPGVVETTTSARPSPA
jgi:hypothetical protein